jgi:hypothetical protein
MTGQSRDRGAQRVLLRRCRHCGSEFEPVRHQVFCKPSCRWAHFDEKRHRGEDTEADLFRVPFE